MNKVVNDFSITVGTKNGSGSSTANNTSLRAIFKMGIPVSGKNLFPSNIQGLPTWYTIRTNKRGQVQTKRFFAQARLSAVADGYAPSFLTNATFVANKILELDPMNLEAKLCKGEVYHRCLGDYSRAIEQYNKVIRLSDGQDDTVNTRARANMSEIMEMLS